jgi:hypothetical protein
MAPGELEAARSQHFYGPGEMSVLALAAQDLVADDNRSEPHRNDEL